MEKDVKKQQTYEENVQVLIKKIFLLVEEGEYKKANELCERILEVDPENAKVYLARLLMDLKVKTIEDLQECRKPFCDNINYKRVMRFAQNGEKETLIQRIEEISERNTKENAKKQENAKYTRAIFICIAAFILVVFLAVTVLMPWAENEKDYKSAIAYMNAKEYQTAIDIFKKINGYRNSEGYIYKCEQAQMEQKYNSATAFLLEENYIEAYTLFASLDFYKDSNIQAQNIFSKYKDARIKNAKVGDIVVMGKYGYDNDIEWIVLGKKDNKMFIVSKHAIDYKPYDTSKEAVSWENCVLRKWLNDYFIDTAFTEEEKNRIMTTTVPYDKISYLSKKQPATQDKVFLLSKEDVNKYFKSDTERQCTPTYYAQEKGASAICYWWTRSADRNDYIKHDYGDGGGVKLKVDPWFFNGVDGGVRPAMVINVG